LRAGSWPEARREDKRNGPYSILVEPQDQRIIGKLPPTSLMHGKGKSGFAGTLATAKGKYTSGHNRCRGVKCLPP
jgi:hypothetical protein